MKQGEKASRVVRMEKIVQVVAMVFVLGRAPHLGTSFLFYVHLSERKIEVHLERTLLQDADQACMCQFLGHCIDPHKELDYELDNYFIDRRGKCLEHWNQTHRVQKCSFSKGPKSFAQDYFTKTHTYRTTSQKQIPVAPEQTTISLRDRRTT